MHYYIHLDPDDFNIKILSWLNICYRPSSMPLFAGQLTGRTSASPSFYPPPSNKLQFPVSILLKTNERANGSFCSQKPRGTVSSFNWPPSLPYTRRQLSYFSPSSSEKEMFIPNGFFHQRLVGVD